MSPKNVTMFPDNAKGTLQVLLRLKMLRGTITLD